MRREGRWGAEIGVSAVQVHCSTPETSPTHVTLTLSLDIMSELFACIAVHFPCMPLVYSLLKGKACTPPTCMTPMLAGTSTRTLSASTSRCSCGPTTASNTVPPARYDSCFGSRWQAERQLPTLSRQVLLRLRCTVYLHDAYAGGHLHQGVICQHQPLQLRPTQRRLWQLPNPAAPQQYRCKECLGC